MVINRRAVVSASSSVEHDSESDDEGEDVREREQKKKTHDTTAVSPSVDFIAGGLISAISKMAVYPMETEVLLIAIGVSVAQDSARLWHGVGLTGFENFLYNGFLWYLKELVRPAPIDPEKPELRPPATFFRAFAVACAAILLVHPLTNIIVGMRASLRDTTLDPLSALQVARAIMTEDGLGGFFTGWQMSLVLRVGAAMTFVVYEFVRTRLAGILGSDLSNLLAGLLGRLSEVLLCHPIKTFRFRMQQGQTMIPSWSPSALLGLWAGVGTTAVADAVKIGIRFLLIERLRSVLQSILVGRHTQQCKKRLKRQLNGSSGAFGQTARGG